MRFKDVIGPVLLSAVAIVAGLGFLAWLIVTTQEPATQFRKACEVRGGFAVEGIDGIFGCLEPRN